jgi:anti-sigma regulatory factor (Ser/Thr protein kinase)
VTGQTAEPIWPPASPPPATAALHWELRDVGELPRVRAELRRHATANQAGEGADRDLVDQVVLALDEMASNALRHGGGDVRATVGLTEDSYLLEVSDQATGAPPAPAVGRDPSEGGLGLYLIAELSTRHGWYVEDAHKHVWALLPRH